MPKTYPTNTNSLSTKDWLKSTKGAHFVSSYPVNPEMESSGEIFTQDDFQNALRKTSAKVEVNNLRTKKSR